MKNIIDVESPEHFAKILKSRKQRYLLKFSTPRCQPCIALDETIELYETENELTILKIDVSQNHELAMIYKVKFAPCCIVINENGEQIACKSGFMKIGTFRAWLDETYFSADIELKKEDNI